MTKEQFPLFSAPLLLALALGFSTATFAAVAPQSAGAPAVHGALAPPVEVVGARDAEPCRSPYFYQPLAIYRDPSLFLGAFASYVADPRRGIDELYKERPLLTRVTGSVALRVLKGEHTFKSFPIIQQMYGDVDARFLAAEAPTILFVVLCGDHNPYRDTLGFVLKADLERAQRPAGGFPPSIEPNPVPQLKAEH